MKIFGSGVTCPDLWFCCRAGWDSNFLTCINMQAWISMSYKNQEDLTPHKLQNVKMTLQVLVLINYLLLWWNTWVQPNSVKKRGSIGLMTPGGHTVQTWQPNFVSVCYHSCRQILKVAQSITWQESGLCLSISLWSHHKDPITHQHQTPDWIKFHPFSATDIRLQGPAFSIWTMIQDPNWDSDHRILLFHSPDFIAQENENQREFIFS